jgi:hypothetical protein
MASENEFAYLEDYVLFGYLVANELCDPSDGPGLARLQRSTSGTKELRHVLGADPKKVAGIGDALQSNMQIKDREGLRGVFPRLPEMLETSRGLASPTGTSCILPIAPATQNQPEVSLAPLIEELRDKRVELGNRERRLEAWADAAVLFMETVESLETNKEIDETRRIAAGSLRKQFGRIFAGLGFVILIPQRGEPFDEKQHIVERIDETERELPPSAVAHCTQWGYHLPSGRILKAKVIITLERKS